MGGITEAKRVVALASAFNTPVIPHGSSVYSYHLQIAFQNCPMAEYINLSKDGDQIVPYFGGLFLDEPLPKGGRILLDSDKAGFGVTLRKDGLMRPFVRSQEEVDCQFKRNAEYLDSFSYDREVKPIYPF
ncbi:Mitochondrial enolase superfamily member 1-like [Oopsacas minuta]|uniref:Mitochondrial enolase superfamily member 1-like n=1 Tax=Oopsacas minuta TaxID=111878 RepID=A0AAV7JLX5_9METZ|nr:Mitochondrial enolase superfamily member 1-like [Oopsacas minuta]